MTCKCGSNRIAHVQGKCSDMSSAEIPHLSFEHDGYVMDLGVGGGDYVEVTFCLDCGQLQNFTPVTDEEIFEMEEYNLKSARFYGEERVTHDSEGPQPKEPEPGVISMKHIEKNRIKTLLIHSYGPDWASSDDAGEVLLDTAADITINDNIRAAAQEIYNER